MLEMRRKDGASYFVATSWEDYLRYEPYSSFWLYLENHFKEVASGAQFTIFDLAAVPNDTFAEPIPNIPAASGSSVPDH
jgi:hypothetical protein